MELDELELSYTLLLDHSALLFGETNSGKSTVIVDFLYHVRPYVDQVIVFCPTDKINRTYEKIIPSPFIHYNIDKTILEKMFERQEGHAQLYARAQNMTIIERFFRQLASNEEKYAIKKLGELIAKCKSEEIRKQLKEHLNKTMKRVIIANRHRMAKWKLSDDEQFVLDHIDFNPRIVVIFDDCTEQLEKAARTDAMQKMFNQGRHNLITFFIACHDDRKIPPGLKDNAFIKMYLKPDTATNILLRNMGKISKEDKLYRQQIIKSTFNDQNKYQKLVYVREDGKYYRFTADVHKNFKFCSSAIWEYAEKIKTAPGTISTNNEFVKNFI